MRSAAKLGKFLGPAKPARATLSASHSATRVEVRIGLPEHLCAAEFLKK
jgi:hypothetical protein